MLLMSQQLISRDMSSMSLFGQLQEPSLLTAMMLSALRSLQLPSLYAPGPCPLNSVPADISGLQFQSLGRHQNPCDMLFCSTLYGA